MKTLMARLDVLSYLRAGTVSDLVSGGPVPEWLYDETELKVLVALAVDILIQLGERGYGLTRWATARRMKLHDVAVLWLKYCKHGKSESRPLTIPVCRKAAEQLIFLCQWLDRH